LLQQGSAANQQCQLTWKPFTLASDRLFVTSVATALHRRESCRSILPSTVMRHHSSALSARKGMSNLKKCAVHLPTHAC